MKKPLYRIYALYPLTGTAAEIIDNDDTEIVSDDFEVLCRHIADCYKAGWPQKLNVSFAIRAD